MIRQRGFTLLEMLAAIAVLVVASSILLGAFAQSSRSLAQVARSDQHNAAARSLMDEFDLSELAAGQKRGSWQGIQWVLNVTLEPTSSARYALYRLDLALHDSARTTHYSTLRARAAGTGK